MMNKLLSALILCSAQLAWSGENAAPSSHFVLDDNFEADLIINEVRVPADGEALYTYYETLGWRGRAGGYAGIQAHPKAHNYIFSIWDHKSHTAPIKAVHRGPGTMTQKFGGEGTGLKSWNFELGWKTDTWYTLVTRCWPVGDHMFYGFWSRSGETGEWTHLVTMDVAAKEAFFRGGTDCFIEDWLETGQNKRTTNLRGAWKRKRSGEWHAASSGRYSVNSWDLVKGKRSFNYRTNWNGGVARDASGEFYFMTAGGAETKPTSANPSKHSIARTEKEPRYDPIRIATATALVGADGNLEVGWSLDPKALPQFDAVLNVYEKARGKGKLLATMKIRDAHTRSARTALPKNFDPEKGSLQLHVRDILDHSCLPFSFEAAKRAGK